MKKRDAKFLVLCAATLLLAGLFIRESHFVVKMIEGGYRKINIELVQRFIQRGELSSKEAMYYRADEGGGGTAR
ncbi:MAG: hypothetical protein V3S11_06960 [Elusimicrobiota bacterium]